MEDYYEVGITGSGEESFGFDILTRSVTLATFNLTFQKSFVFEVISLASRIAATSMA